MVVVELAADGASRVLERVVHPFALGADTFRLGYIRPQTLRDLGQILRNLRQVLKTYDVDAVRTIGTSAIRDASNRDIAIDRLNHASGFRLVPIEPSEESRIAYGCLLPFLRANRVPGRRHVLVLDLGGGSTELLVLRGERIILGESHRLGVARLLYRAADDLRVDAPSFLDSTIRDAVAASRELLRHISVRELVAVNSVLGAALTGEPRVRRLEGGVAVDSKHLARIHAEAATLSLQELGDRFHLGPADAELLVPALAILHRFAEVTGVPRVLLTEVDFVAGVVEDARQDLMGRNPLLAFRRQIVGSVTGILEKYRADALHARQVRVLALDLFDALGPYLDLDERDRLLLELAALLHDVGRFISDRDHHKHSLYIIQWTEIVGLSERDRLLVGAVARYHRRARPRPDHPEFDRLPPADRMRVSKLAALLRLADAMDRSHRQIVRRLVVAVGETQVDIAADATGDMAVEQAAVESKGNLFTDLTGLTIRFRRILS
jgi:exopolyphosphatase/guanosine-5'-triphosphate,3'-diphosphate pyrophosphatase